MIGSIMKDQDKQGERPSDKQDADKQQPEPHKIRPRGKTFAGRGVEKKG